MTPLQIKMMLHYFCCAGPYAEKDQHHATSDAVLLQRTQLIAEGMLSPTRCQSGFHVTERGRVYVEALQAVPLPINKWVMPGGEDE